LEIEATTPGEIARGEIVLGDVVLGDKVHLDVALGDKVHLDVALGVLTQCIMAHGILALGDQIMNAVNLVDLEDREKDHALGVQVKKMNVPEPEKEVEGETEADHAHVKGEEIDHKEDKMVNHGKE